MNLKNNVNRFNGFAESYDQYRPTPPSIINDIIIQYLEKNPEVVADLGCGTGLSTFIWKPYAKEVIGIDPNNEMLNKAIDNSPDHNQFKFSLGFSNDTKLKSNSVDVVTCSSSFQWMEPTSTIKEVLRILTSGGIYAIYNHNHPPMIDWKIEKEFKTLLYKIYHTLDQLREEIGVEKLWTDQEYHEIVKSQFQFINDIFVHHTIKMKAEDFIGYTLSQGALQEIIKLEHPLINEITQFTELVKERLKDMSYDVTFSYRLKVAKKQ